MNLALKTMACLLGLSLGGAARADSGCRLPSGGEDETDPRACFSSPGLRFVVDPPRGLTPETLRAGPPSAKSFDLAETVHCAFTPHEKSQVSPKFRCNLTDAAGVYFDEDHAAVPEARSADDRGDLLDHAGRPLVDARGKRRQADEIKIKYFRGGRQQGAHFEGTREIREPRHREGFVETAVSRLFWAMGLPVDRMYNVDRLTCRGCGDHPFEQERAQPGDATFRFVGVERKLEGKTIAKEWSFGEIGERHYPAWSPRLRAEYEVYLIGLGLLHYTHGLSKQNRVACPKGSYDKNTLECRAPLAFVQDVGASFGAGNGERGSLTGWASSRVFKRGCELAESWGPVKRVSPAALALARERLAPLDRTLVKLIFRVARFDRMDPELTRRMGGGEAVLDAWADGLMRRIQEVRSARCE